jgi:hypothetical protein
MCRARIVEEIKGPEPFRLARLEAMPDFLPSTPVIDREHRRSELLSLFQTLFPGVASRSTLAPLMDEKVTLSSICDVLAFAMKMPAAESYRVLAEPNVDVRSELVLEHLKLRIRAERSGLVEATFPPAFSAN